MPLTVVPASRILDRTVPLASAMPVRPCAPRADVGARMRVAPGVLGGTSETKEAVVSDGGRDEEDARRYAEERAEHERRFQALPPAGSMAYWERLEDAQHPLPLEVLTRCLRERYFAGAEDDADRVMERLVRSVQKQVGFWSRGIAEHSRAAKHQGIADDLAQECYRALWEDLIDEDDHFFQTHFISALTRLEQHVAHQVMTQAGEWTRQGTKKSSRVPVKERDSINAPRTDDDGHPLDLDLADTSSADDFERLEAQVIVADLLNQCDEQERRLVDAIFFRGITQKEAAAELGTTDRTIRNMLTRLCTKLRDLASDGEEGSGGTR